MFTISGISVSPGIAIGKAVILSHTLNEAEAKSITFGQIKAEVSKFKKALIQSQNELLKIKRDLVISQMGNFTSFIDIHLSILKDDKISKNTIDTIRSKLCNAEWALKLQADEIIRRFEKITNPYIQERKNDVMQVCENIAKYIVGSNHKISQKKNNILVAHDISPADALKFKSSNFISFITDIGGPTSHTAILARSINIPSIVGLQNAKKLIKNDDLIIVDGDSSSVIVNPNSNVLHDYHLRKNHWDTEQKKLFKLAKIKSKTIDKKNIQLLTNIEDEADVKSIFSNNADGVGLFRTEFIFMSKGKMLSENEQFSIYKRLASNLKNKELIIRTLDSGADKVIDNSNADTQNPALGLRAIRLCLAEPDIFITQIKAILRASVYGNVKILIPMLSSINELNQVKLLIKRAKTLLDAENKKYDSNILIGGMIEIPAAAIHIDSFAKQLDFLSIGTNDLIQYTLAVDRTDDSVSHLYNSIHPAILKLIHNTIKAGQKFNIPVSLCGEMAGDHRYTKLLLGMGLYIFSMHPASILRVKKKIIETNCKKNTRIINKILKSEQQSSIEALVTKLNQS
jgi:phosphotransferase system enzyme I (PtsI)